MKKAHVIAIGMVLILTTTILSAATTTPQSPKMSGQWWGKAPGKQLPNQDVTRGAVESVNAQNISVRTEQGVKSYAVAPKTRVFVKGVSAAIADVKIGDRVVVRSKLINNVSTALVIRVPKPNVSGAIISINGNAIVLKDKNNVESHVVVNSNTKFVSHGYQGSLSDLRVGYRVVAIGNITGNELAAVEVEFVPKVAKGVVTAVQGDTITIKTIRQRIINAQASPATAVLIRPRVAANQKGTLSDVKVNMPANIGFRVNPDGSIQLLWIDLLTGS